MQISTSAIVLAYTKYSDSSIILHLYTKELGKTSVMVYGISNKRKNKLAYFQSLYLLDVIISFKASRQIQSLKELKVYPVLPNLSGDFIKSTQALFLAEVLNKSLNSTESDEELFEFLFNSIQMLNALENYYNLFHLAFMIKLSRYLGIWFEPENFSTGYYDFRSGNLFVEQPTHPYYMSHEIYAICKLMNTTPYDSYQGFQVSTIQRDQCLRSMVKLYEFHVTNFNQLNALSVLTEVFA